MIEPLRMSFQVDCPVEHAFATWTEKTSQWWPTSHSVSGDKGLRVIIEPRAGGRIFERTPTGAEIDWGEVLVWDPPQRLSYLWHLRTDRSDATEVEIIFAHVDNQTTRVDIEHRGWERLGARAETWRERNVAGWSGLLPRYVAACAS
jgi:uncharacterized protein YndB with AHSA1/START domain